VKIRLNIKYLCAFIIIFIIEVLIAAFINDKFIRPYVGDILVVVLIYCFIRSFVGKEVKLLPLYIFVFAVLTEVGQYFHLAKLLGLSDYKIARIIIGSTFDLKDIACYLAGCTGLFLFEMVKRRANEKEKQGEMPLMPGKQGGQKGRR
jgi:DNA integrity scanning protein DisA with diadenylate cyclase activity